MIGTTNATLESKWELLWVNPNPDAPFAPQTVLLNLQENDLIMIGASYGYASHNCIDHWLTIAKSTPYSIHMVLETGDGSQTRSRQCVIALTEITFSEGGLGTNYSAANYRQTTDNTHIRPYTIMRKHGAIAEYPLQ